MCTSPSHNFLCWALGYLFALPARNWSLNAIDHVASILFVFLWRCSGIEGCHLWALCYCSLSQGSPWHVKDKRSKWFWNWYISSLFLLVHRSARRGVDFTTLGWLTILPFVHHHFDLFPQQVCGALSLCYDRPMMMPVLWWLWYRF